MHLLWCLWESRPHPSFRPKPQRLFGKPRRLFNDKLRSFSPRNAKAESTRRKIHRGWIFLQAFSAFAPLRFLKELYFFICFAMITGAILL
jgi:hypothetical protein